MVVPAGVTIALTITAFGLIGDAARDWNAARTTDIALPTQGSKADSRARSQLRVEVSVDVRRSAGRIAVAPASTAAVLSVQDLTVSATGRAGTVPVLDGVSFFVDPGEALGIVGESGCGKTMAALSVVGLLPPGVQIAGGSISLLGEHIGDADERRLRQLRGSTVSMVFQEPVSSLDPCFTVGAQLVEVVRRHSDHSRVDARREAIRLLELVEIPAPERVAAQYPHQLSGGMAQRVAIAAALAGSPKLLIADEPTTALDVTVQSEILALLRTLRERADVALIIVSHDWGVIADSCDRAVVMYAGQTVEEAPISSLFAEPRHPYTRALMLSNPHYAHEPRTLLPSISGSVPAVGAWPPGCRFAPRCQFATEACVDGLIDEKLVEADHLVRCIHADDLGKLELPGVTRR
jgi:peptide/nickel transport system permease protein